jgi:hypothetical protein
VEKKWNEDHRKARSGDASQNASNDRTSQADVSRTSGQTAGESEGDSQCHAEQPVRGRRLGRFDGHSRIEADNGACNRTFRAAKAAEAGRILRLLVQSMVRELAAQCRE